MGIACVSSYNLSSFALLLTHNEMLFLWLLSWLTPLHSDLVLSIPFSNVGPSVRLFHYPYFFFHNSNHNLEIMCLFTCILSEVPDYTIKSVRTRILLLFYPQIPQKNTYYIEDAKKNDVVKN